MADKPVAAAVRNPQQGQGVIKRFFELLMMLVSMFLVIFAWGEVGKPSWIEYFNPPPLMLQLLMLQASKAKEEAASLRGELRLARSEQADRWVGQYFQLVTDGLDVSSDIN